MARLLQSPPKFHPHEWKQSNQVQYLTADAERSAAERLRDECERVIQTTEAKTRKAQEDVARNLSKRIGDVEFWKEEVRRKIEEATKEISSLNSSKEELEFALQSTIVPMDVARTCMSYREGRRAIDLVHDDVEIQLMKEVEVIGGVQGLLQKTLDETNEQIRILKSCKYKLEKDIGDKMQALEIDQRSAGMGEGTMLSPTAVAVDPKSVTPSQWEGFSNDNILKTEKERNASSTLRGVNRGVLNQTQQDVLRQREVVNQAFDQRIKETEETKENLERHLAKVNEDISAMEANISALEKAIADKYGPNMLAQTRLLLRANRPNVELVYDPPQQRLIQEVGEIAGSINQLQQKLEESQSALKGLLRRQLSPLTQRSGCNTIQSWCGWL
jgi:hypothetical protein